MTPQNSKANSNPVPAILALSAVVAAFLVWLIYFKERLVTPEWAMGIPLSNAIFNSISAICLSLGYWNIRRRNKTAHMRFMIAATVSSAFFLVGYITYHYFHGDTKFPQGYGWVRPAYFALLISHITASAIALPLIFTTLWFAITKNFRRHKAVSRWTFPIWLYVSVTGVLVYVVLNHYAA
jgi:putative membrane protein